MQSLFAAYTSIGHPDYRLLESNRSTDFTEVIKDSELK